mgnify:FL=1
MQHGAELLTIMYPFPSSNLQAAAATILQAHQGPVRSVRLTGDGSRLATASQVLNGPGPTTGLDMV